MVIGVKGPKLIAYWGVVVGRGGARDRKGLTKLLSASELKRTWAIDPRSNFSTCSVA